MNIEKWAYKLLLLMLLVVVPVQVNATVLYHDDFEDGNFLSGSSDGGLAWVVVRGGLTMNQVSGEGWRLGVNRGGTLAVSNQVIELEKFTLCFDGQITWSEAAHIILLYKDQNNYYSVCIGSNPGIYKTINGRQIQLKADSGSVIRLSHSSASAGTFKIAVSRLVSGIRFEVDKAGDGVDYDLIYDDHSVEAQRYSRYGKIGVATASSDENSPWFYIDNIIVHDERVSDDRLPVHYYIDSTNGDDSRTSQEAQSPGTAWQTIQRAADIMLSGDVAYVMPGTYRESVVPAASGMEDQPVIYKAYDQSDKPVMDGSEMVTLSGWQSTQITDFRGVVRDVYKTTIDWLPDAVFQDNVRMFESQEPNQSDANDTYNHQEFMDLPSAYNGGTSSTVLVDPGFLTQTAGDYWSGALLMLYDGYANAVDTGRITSYDPGLHQLTAGDISRLIGNDHDRDDRYAIRDHFGLIDQPGEYFVDTSVTPYELYVWPYDASALDTISAARYDYAFDLSGGYLKNIVIDGFEMRQYNGGGVSVQSGCENIVIKNCNIHHTMGSGVNVSRAKNITVAGCSVHDNYNNGVSFGYGEQYTVEYCDITANGNNGIWVGTGGGDIFNAYDIIIRHNKIHRQGGLRMHPDNHQMHQVKNILFEGNVLIQDGHQNMWTQYCDNYTLRNNIFIGGTLGINSSMHNYVYHNVFYQSSLRYDAHLDNHPERGDYYKPQEVRIENNIIIDSAITMPDAGIVDWSVFTITHNYYNIENNWLRTSWGDRGVGFDNKSIVETDSSSLPSVITQVPDSGFTTYDFHLLSSSPCIDAGLNVHVTDDLDGNRRPQKSGYDIGPYELAYPYRVPGTDAVYVMNNIIAEDKHQEAIIRCRLDQPGRIVIKIFTSGGHQLIKLADGNFLDGVHVFKWNGKDSNGQEAGSGIYLTYIKTGDEVNIRKIAVVH